VPAYHRYLIDVMIMTVMKTAGILINIFKSTDVSGWQYILGLRIHDEPRVVVHPCNPSYSGG
jgi:hypothetical protein